MAILGVCRTCRKSVSSEAEACPQCGQPMPFDKGPLPKVGEVCRGEVTKIMDFGAFVKIDPGRHEGLVHISQISEDKVENVSDKLMEGEIVRVKVLEIDRHLRIRLTMRI